MHIQEIGENILMAFDTLRTHKVRSALTMLGVIGVSPSMIVGSFGPGGTQPVVKYQGTEANRPIIFGVSSNYDVVRNVYIEQGRFFSTAEEQHRAQVAVIGYAIADTLFGSNDPMGKEIEVDGKVFQVIGVMEKAPGGLFGGDPVEDRELLVPFDTIKRDHPEIKDITINARAEA